MSPSDIPHPAWPDDNAVKPTICPDCECPLIWTGPNTALCACNGDAYDEAAQADNRGEYETTEIQVETPRGWIGVVQATTYSNAEGVDYWTIRTDSGRVCLHRADNCRVLNDDD
jgi:hypothetical protein